MCLSTVCGDIVSSSAISFFTYPWVSSWRPRLTVVYLDNASQGMRVRNSVLLNFKGRYRPVSTGALNAADDNTYSGNTIGYNEAIEANAGLQAEHAYLSSKLDTDKDGTPDTIEIGVGTDPNNASEAFDLLLTRENSGGINLSWPSKRYARFNIEHSESLTAWDTLLQRLVADKKSIISTGALIVFRASCIR